MSVAELQEKNRRNFSVLQWADCFKPQEEIKSEPKMYDSQAPGMSLSDSISGISVEMAHTDFHYNISIGYSKNRIGVFFVMD